MFIRSAMQSHYAVGVCQPCPLKKNQSKKKHAFHASRGHHYCEAKSATIDIWHSSRSIHVCEMLLTTFLEITIRAIKCIV